MSSSAPVQRIRVVSLVSVVTLALLSSCTDGVERCEGDDCTARDDSGIHETPDANTQEPDANLTPMDAAVPDDASMPDPMDASPIDMDAGGRDLTPDFSNAARVYFELNVVPVLMNPANLCVNCHTYAYGYARNINFLQVGGGVTLYDGLRTWVTSYGEALIRTSEVEATMPSESLLFSRGMHGFSGVAPAFPVGSLGIAKNWVMKERDACRQRMDTTGDTAAWCKIVDAGSSGVTDGGGLHLTPRDEAQIEFETYIRPMINAKGCATCHAGTGAYASFGVNFLASFPNPNPTQYDSILSYKLAAGVPYLFNFNQLEQSEILRHGAHIGPALASLPADRAEVIRWLELERAAACDEGTVPCEIPDAGPQDPADASMEIPDAAMGDDDGGGAVSPIEASRQFYYANVSNVLRAQGCYFCHAGSFGSMMHVNYMDRLGGEFEYESVVDYISADFRQLYDVTNPAQSLMLTKGQHLGDPYGRPQSPEFDIENFKTWVLMEKNAQQVTIVDAGPRPDAARPDAGRDAGMDAGHDAGPRMDSGPPSHRQQAEDYFNDHIYPRLTQRSCVACHTGPLSQSYAPPENWLDVDNLGPYRSVLAWRTSSNYMLIDYDEPQYSLLFIKPKHYSNLAPAYHDSTMMDPNALPEFTEWVRLEKLAATDEGTYHPPVPDAGQPDANMGIPDAAVRLDAGIQDAGGERPDASVQRADARQFFLDRVYRNLSTETRPEATCQSCHVQGNRPTPFMIRPGESTALAEQRYQFIRANNNLVNKQVPSASLFLIKDENHEGGQGLIRPGNMSEADRTDFLTWVAMEKAADDWENGVVNGGAQASTCETQFLPAVPPPGSTFPEETTIDLRTTLCRTDLAGAAASIRATRIGSGLEFTYLTVVTPPGKALRVTDPLLTRWTRSTTADGGVRYFPAEIVHVNRAFNRLIPGGSSFRITTTPGVIMSSFFGAGGNPDAGGLSSYLSIEFDFIGEEVGVADAGTPVDAGPVPLVPCANVMGTANSFVTAVKPRLMNRSADGGGFACIDCHMGGPGFTRSTAAMDLTQINSNPAAACASVKQWVTVGAPGSSLLFQNVDEDNHNTAHPVYLPASELMNFQTAVTPWIQSEAQ